MLTITDIKKVYRTGDMVQQALGGVSISLRDSEFVAILGASGSGKTTLLNIIGGLDRYDEGDLIINGVSTKRYTDRDWDSYRNHTVGFVFQSYNLIPHQTILKNVELALTISGVSAEDRTVRATEALEKVGLSGHIHKKPSQLSGGQMQRVAIARALVNDPDILLADEPTGALDSETSVQVLDLLKEVARDRLVVMVTHNPELAERYATRIITLKDGMITSDSDPFDPESTEAVHRSPGRASMSFLTALSLSFNNLRTKLTRTILVAFAGSIGIIGIALILSTSTGANKYIHDVEENSLQEYPLTINSTSFSMLSLFTEASAGMEDNTADAENHKDVDEWRAVTSFFSGIRSNDLKSLRTYFESADCDIYDYVQALEYKYTLTPQIYRLDGDDYRQVNPDTTFSSFGMTGSGSSSLMSSFSDTDSFFPLPRDEGLLYSSYDLKAGKYPTDIDECVIMLSPSGRVTDMTLYILGIKDPAELEDMIKAFNDGTVSEADSPAGSYSYDELLGAEFSVLSPSDFYIYDEEYKVWTDRSSDKKYMKELLKTAEKLRVVGIVQPNDHANSSTMDVGFAYTAGLTDHLMQRAADSDIVKSQLADPEINVITGEPFGSAKDNSGLDLSAMFSVDKDKIAKAFDMDASDMDLSSLNLNSVDFSDIDLSSAISGIDMSSAFSSLSGDDITELISSVSIDISADDLKALFGDVVSGYLSYSADDPRSDIKSLPSAIYRYLGTDEAQGMILSKLRGIIEKNSKNLITAEDLSSVISSVVAGYPAYLESAELTDDGDYTYFDAYMRSDEAQAIISGSLNTLRRKLVSSLITQDDAADLVKTISEGFEDYADENDLPSAGYLISSFADYLNTEPAKKLIASAVEKAVDLSGTQQLASKYAERVSGQMADVMQTILYAAGDKISSALSGAMAGLTGGLSDNIMNAFKFDTDSLSEMFKSNMSAEELRDLMLSLYSGTETSYDSNLRKLGYASIDSPSSIVIYPSDFESKSHIKDIISGYNERAAAAGDDDKVIQYTDMVDALMSSVTVIIDVISYVLIAFVAISLVVSSIMIGVITYISVLERRKEIGILRAIGASKRNISQVFNAETFIIGALAGVIGIAITELLIIPANLAIHALSGVQEVNAYLPPVSAVILILLSIVLTLIGGIIPSRKAAKSDPVAALRSE